MLPKVKQMEHERKEQLKQQKDPNYVIQPYIPNKGGRPRKDVLAKAKMTKGRPSVNSRIEEFKSRLLATNGQKVIDKVIEIALTDDHKDQMAALKMCMDRVLPVSLFEKGSGERAAVQINIINSTVESNEKSGTVDVSVIDVEAVEEEGESENV